MPASIANDRADAPTELAAYGIAVLVTIIVLGVIAVVGLAGLVVRRYLGALAEETGKHDADRLERWRERRRSRLGSSVLPGQLSRGPDLPARSEVETLPAAEAGSLPARGGRRTVEPPPGIAPARAVVVAVSSTSRQDAFLSAIAAATEGARYLAVSTGSPTQRHPFQHFEGDLLTQLEAAMESAVSAVHDGTADGIAVFLDVPLSGSWDNEVGVDLARFFGTLLRDEDCAIWITYEEPIDISSWPDEVFVEAPVAAASLRRFLIECGLAELHDESSFAAVGNALRVTPAIAARALLALGGEVLPSAVGGATEPPAYASYLVLAIGSERLRSTAASVTRETAVAADLQAFMQDQGIRIVRVDTGGVLPLTPYRGRVTAWRRAAQPTPRVDDRALAAGDRAQAEHAQRELEHLGEAISEGNASLAAAVLVHSGRAWIETQDAPQYRERLDETLHAFGLASSPGLWAHYLLALDSALRRNEPEARWFGPDVCDIAQRFGMSPLFRAEQMEFARLRGDFPEAAQLAARLFPALAGEIERSAPGDIYVDATARYVLANVLRRGGRYDIARSLIDTAHKAYDRRVPSHLVEWLHCRYALSVCDALAGVPRVEPDQGLEAGQLVFARSLVTLSNAQASWFIGDYARAIEFAAHAEEGFRSIGYSRYASRAAGVASVLTEWRRFAEGQPVDGAAASPIIEHIRVATSGSSELIDLQDLRPSAALTVLQFATSFATDTAASCKVVNPGVIILDGDLVLQLTEPSSFESIADADAALRDALGVGRERLVPLLPD